MYSNDAIMCECLRFEWNESRHKWETDKMFKRFSAIQWYGFRSQTIPSIFCALDSFVQFFLSL